MLRLRSTTLAILPCILNAVALAQSAKLSGTITDPDGGFVKDASIQAKNSANGAVVREIGSSKGDYSIALPAGTYDIAVVMPCCQYGTFTQPGVTLRAGELRRMDVHLPWGTNLGTLADDPILLLNEFRGACCGSHGAYAAHPRRQAGSLRHLDQRV